MINSKCTKKITIEKGVCQGCLYSMVLFVISSIRLIQMIKDDLITHALTMTDVQGNFCIL